MRRRQSSCLIGLVALGSLWSSNASGQGFRSFIGQTDEVVLSRKRPPILYLMGTEIAVRVSASVPEAQQLTTRLGKAIESDLFKQDPRLKPASREPESVILCTISSLETTESSTSRVVTERKHVRDEKVWNESKKKYDTKPVYENVQVTRTYKVVTGTLAVSYQAKDERSGQVLDSSNFNPTFSKEYENGTGAPSASGVQDILVQQLLSSIVPRLVPTREPVKVLLAKDKRLDESNKLGQAGLWNKALEKLTLMVAFSSPKDDAYRQYNIGVANEAMAYDADDLAVSTKLLEQASIQYGKALEMNPGEKYFREPQTRIAASIAAYKKSADQVVAFAQLVEEQRRAAEQRALVAATEGAKSLAETKSPATADAKSKPFNNDRVVSLVKAGIDDDNLIATIRAEKAVEFDLSAAGLQMLLEAKVSNRAIAAMRGKQVSAKKAPATSGKASGRGSTGPPTKAPAAPPKGPGGL